MLKTIVHNSRYILLPGGRDYEGCVGIFEKVFDIKVPEFPDRSLSVEHDGKRFIKVKSRDVPMLIQQGYADIGIAYTDVCRENISINTNVEYKEIGETALKLSVLFPVHKEKEVERRLASAVEPLTVVTAYPRLLRQWLDEMPVSNRLNITISSLVPSGSVEAMVALDIADAAVDVVNTGATARANGLSVMPLLDIRPAVIYRK